MTDLLKVLVTFKDGSTKEFEVFAWTVRERFLILTYGEPAMRHYINMDEIFITSMLEPPAPAFETEEE